LARFSLLFVALNEGRAVVGKEVDDLISAVTVEIMRYLALNRSAGDTAMGVWQWWLSATRDKVTKQLVEAALERLAASGAIGVRVLASGERYYFGLGP
jgi:predicted N-acetyltransferase YhbS